jgi:ankyrin repeat protein
MHAAFYGHLEMATMLCQRKDINVNIENSAGETALKRAMISWHREIADLIQNR